MATHRSYHHGNLRPVLLAEAERTLREHGVDKLSLRDLARQTGVSHSAPRRHFADRQALLDALAEAGFARLADGMSMAIADTSQDFQTRLRAAATAYVDFATQNAALLELMFASKNDRKHSALPEGGVRLYNMVGDLISQGQQARLLPPGDSERLRLLLLATLQGIAALITSGRAHPQQTDELLIDAVHLFTRNTH